MKTSQFWKLKNPQNLIYCRLQIENKLHFQKNIDNFFVRLVKKGFQHRNILQY